MNIGIVNYSIGNVGSVYSALEFYHYNVRLVDNPGILKNSDLIVLAGVGNFSTATFRLKSLKLWETIDYYVRQKKKPLLGICLGMQLFADSSLEGGENSGFGWIKGKVVKLEGKEMQLPHMGWNRVELARTKLFQGVRYGFFYYMHSYHFIPDDPKVILAKTPYGSTDLVACVKKDNIIGVQFHPEKSQGDGLRFLRNAIEELL